METGWYWAASKKGEGLGLAIVVVALIECISSVRVSGAFSSFASWGRVMGGPGVDACGFIQ